VTHVSVTSTPLLVELLDVLRRDPIRALHRRDERGIRRYVARVFKWSDCVAVAATPRVADWFARAGASPL